MLRLIGLILPLCLDTFAVAAAVGMTRPGPHTRIRLGLLFSAFEGGMPLVGLAVGVVAGRLVGSFADYVAIVALVGLGIYMTVFSDEKDEASARKLLSSNGPAMIGLGFSISLDELAIGFTLGLLRVPVAAAVILIAVQAFVASQVGFQVGARVGERFREAAERLAGLVLVGLGAALLIAKVASIPV